MKRIIFYVGGEWSMGRYHSDLVKFLFKHGVESQLLNYSIGYACEEIYELSKVVDYFVTNGSGAAVLHRSYRVPLEKIILVLYHPVDLHDVIQSNIDLTKFAKITTTASWIIPIAKEKNITDIQLVRLATNTAAFKLPISNQLSTIGYAQAFHTRQETEHWKQINLHQPKVYKRGYLVKEIAEELGMPFRTANPLRQTYISMPGFYNTVDVVICSSSDEGAGGSLAEAGCAGRLCITTDVGAYKEFIGEESADPAPVEEKEFKEHVKSLIIYYKNNPQKYRDRCQQIQDAALKKFDYELVVNDWINLIEN